MGKNASQKPLTGTVAFGETVRTFTVNIPHNYWSFRVPAGVEFVTLRSGSVDYSIGVDQRPLDAAYNADFAWALTATSVPPRANTGRIPVKPGDVVRMKRTDAGVIGSIGVILEGNGAIGVFGWPDITAEPIFFEPGALKASSTVDNASGYNANATSIMIASLPAVVEIGDVVLVTRTDEQMLITNIAGNTLTVVRGHNDTDNEAIVDEDPVEFYAPPGPSA
jgi:hypothetical protein